VDAVPAFAQWSLQKRWPGLAEHLHPSCAQRVVGAPPELESGVMVDPSCFRGH
jgi:hypothetical protein